MNKEKDPYSRQKKYYKKHREDLNKKRADRINYLRKLGLKAEKMGIKLDEETENIDDKKS